MSVSRVSPPLKQSGIALITVLLIVAILTAIISRMTLSNELWISQVSNGMAMARLYQADYAAQRWIALILEQDEADVDGYTDLWARPLPPVPVGEGYIGGQIEDMQARFNVNNLINDDGSVNGLNAGRFRRLLQLLKLDTSITEAIIDWIDPDDVQSGTGGAESGYYSALYPSYRCSNRPVSDIAELRLVRGIDLQTFHVLKSYVTALPQVTAINVNTASPEVLAAVVTDWGRPAIALGEARRWVGQIEGNPVRDMQTFSIMAFGTHEGNVPPDLSVNSEYFMAHTRLIFGDLEHGFATLLYRRGNRSIILSNQREFM